MSNSGWIPVRHRQPGGTGIKGVPGHLFHSGRPHRKDAASGCNPPQSLYGKRVTFLPQVPTEGLPAYKDLLKPQVITAILCHHYYQKEQRREATEICYQLLDDSGVYITVENTMPESAQGTQLNIERWKRFQIEHGRLKVMAEKHAARFNSEYFPVPCRNTDAAAGNGFQNGGTVLEITLASRLLRNK